MIAVCRPFDPARLPSAPAAGECHVWTVRFDDPPAFDGLSADEYERAARFTIDRPRRQFVAARGALRLILGRYLGVESAAVPLAVSPAGKPELAGGEFHFNVTHSGGIGLIAVARVRVGVDVEEVREVPNATGLVGRFFAAEEREAFDQLAAADRPAGFLRGWTCKEAILKAVGVGLRDVQECWVELDPRRPPAVRRFAHPPREGLAWALAAWSPGPGYVAALAVETGDAIQFRWE